MSYQSTVERLRSTTERQVMGAWQLHDAGRITRDQFAQLAAAIVARANGRAYALADVSLAADLTWLTRSVTAVTASLPPVQDPERLRRGLSTILDGDPDGALERLVRFARSEPLTATQRAYGDGIARSQQVEGWVRGLDPDPCELCRWWWREGRVWPKSHRMPTHTGCACTPIPVLVDRVAPRVYGGRDVRRR